MTDQFSGKRPGPQFGELHLDAENVELLLAEAWNYGGTAAVK